MISKLGYNLFVSVFILHLSFGESTKEGALACVRIKGRFQWAVYLKNPDVINKFSWYGCKVPRSFWDLTPVPNDCLCDEEEKSTKTSTIFIPEKCFKPDGKHSDWLQTCILNERKSMINVPVVRILNDFLRLSNENELGNTGSFFRKLEEKLKPIVVYIFRGNMEDDQLESRINAYFKQTMRKFHCSMIKAVKLHNAILNIISQIGPEDFAHILQSQPCLLKDNTLRGQQFIIAFVTKYIAPYQAYAPTIVIPSTGKDTIRHITQRLNEKHIRYVVINYKTYTHVLANIIHFDDAKIVYAWTVDSSKASELPDIILKEIQEYFLNTKGDDSRAFMDIQGSDKNDHYCTSAVGCIKLSVSSKDIFENEGKRIPESFSNLGVQFLRYTSASQENPIPDLIESDVPCLQNKNSLYYIIHGFTDNGKKEWISDMKNALLEQQPDSTIVVVDWEKGAKTWWKTNYYQSAVNTYALGAIVAYAIKKHYTESGCFNPSNIHVIGHSLGGQTAGFVGHTFRIISGVKLGRISGLDPAGPFFGEKDPYLRLDHTDAEYVEVLHTNARKGDEVLSGTDAGVHLKFGVKCPAGHIDFYVNGGVSQPGCLLHVPGCSHVRSQAYFTESIKSAGCKFVGFRCKGNDTSAKVENCISKTDYDMNDRTVIGSGKTKGIYYVETTSNKNQYCNSTIWSQYPSSK